MIKNKNTHKRKIQMAKSMRTPTEEKVGVGLFDSKEWRKRKEQKMFQEIKKTKRGIITLKK